MKRIVDKMRVLFISMELVAAPLPTFLEKVPNLFADTKVIPLFHLWMATTLQELITPLKLDFGQQKSVVLC